MGYKHSFFKLLRFIFLDANKKVIHFLIPEEKSKDIN